MSPSTVPPPPAPSPRAAGQEGTNSLAVVGLVLAVLALALSYLSVIGTLRSLGGYSVLMPVPVSIAAIVVGHVALAQAKRFPPGRGRRGLAITDLVLGYLALVGVVAYVALLLYAFFTVG